MTGPLGWMLLQTWRPLEFDLPKPEPSVDIPWSIPVAVVVALGLILFLRRSRKQYESFPQLPLATSSGEIPLEEAVTVVIPARNEAKNIERCVRSFPFTRVIVVDDASSDGTAAAARKAGAEVIPAPPLKKPVKGKSNAMIAGAKLVETPYLYFADADTWYHPHFLHSLVRYAAQNECILVTAFLRIQCRGLWEWMLEPYAMALLFCAINARKAHDFAEAHSFANGQSMLFLRTAYEFIGGHVPVQSSVIEDVALASKVKRHRMKLQIVRAEHLGKVRLYDSLESIWQGVRKNSLRFLHANQASVWPVALASLFLLSVGPVAAWLYWEGYWFLTFAFLLLPVYLLAPWYGSVVRAFLSLPAIYVFQIIALDAMLSATLGRKAIWKGRPV